MSKGYIPPRVWQDNSDNAGLNRPIAGATHDKELAVGEHPFQLYSMGTPNGQKVTIMFEELLALGKDAEYDAHLIAIGQGDQFGSGFVQVNPNSKIPALVDRSSDEEMTLFESGNILLHLAEKFNVLIPRSGQARAEVMNWLFWLQGSAPYLGGGFGHFYAFAAEKLEYPIDRFTMETKRQLDLLDKQLATKRFIAGDGYSIADIAIWPWYGCLVLGRLYGAKEFIDADSYTNLVRWAQEIDARPAVQRGRIVNRTWGDGAHLAERHSAQDIDAALASQ